VKAFAAHAPYIAGQDTLACTKGMDEDVAAGQALRVLQFRMSPWDRCPTLTNFYEQLTLVGPGHCASS
jgi:hypothetical protein